jgi:hypothetical protein
MLAAYGASEGVGCALGRAAVERWRGWVAVGYAGRHAEYNSSNGSVYILYNGACFGTGTVEFQYVISVVPVPIVITCKAGVQETNSDYAQGGRRAARGMGTGHEVNEAAVGAVA